MLINEISVVIPCFNSVNYLPQTLHAILVSLEKSEIPNFEVVLVDDGSTDGLSEKTFISIKGLRYIHQANLGRLMARKTGLELARFNNVLMIDSRVILSEDSIKYLKSKYLTEDFVSGPTEFSPNSNLVGLFWSAISRVVWWRFYYSDGPFKLLVKNFNHYPKGTTCLFGNRLVFLSETNKLLSASSGNAKYRNDDTPLIRSLVLNNEFWIDKKFHATYFPREKVLEFLKHAFHRGRVFFDGFPGARLKIVSLIFLFFGLSFFLHQIFFLISFLLMSHLLIFSLAMYRRVPFRETRSLLFFGLLFISAYSLGYLRAFLDKVFSK
jgi:glycosyltransferase involved in cell wall biosynthesis